MAAPVNPVPSTEQVIEQHLAECGLDRAGFTVRYEPDLQSIEIVIGPKAKATNDQFACIQKAVGYEILTFSNGAMQRAYLDYTNELARPQVLAMARSQLEKEGLLADFPERQNFDSTSLYAQALEKHCKLVPGKALTTSGNDIAFQPNPEEALNMKAFTKKYSCLLLAMQYAGALEREVKFGFIGNEAYSEEGQ
ncbi:hypothetical protein [Novosphingobium sp. 9]|uniref:hypothetical protein n=1 Tax=Novosphingobium sp. 9 TaxID=2025349 RepID=UPI0021B55D79|nr:hypothetical protein [Novosphingobium sp. 9]